MTEQLLPINNAEGVLLVDKPIGLTSAAVVGKIKRRFKLNKVGHAGTLDPLATGLLVLLCGKATKLQASFLGADKVYEGIIALGFGTDTDDITGQVIARGSTLTELSEAEYFLLAQELVSKFIGEQLQVPPKYSAKKIDGKRGYALARAGKDFEPRPQTIIVKALKLNFLGHGKLAYYVRCSKGTYIRSLARDIGTYLKTYACIESIRRLESEPFSVEKAKTLLEIEKLSGLSEILVKTN